MRVELTYTRRSDPLGRPLDAGYWEQCPRCDAFEVVDAVPAIKRTCVWCKRQSAAYRCDSCGQQFEASDDTLQQFEAGELRAAMCEPCLDRAAEIQLGML